MLEESLESEESFVLESFDEVLESADSFELVSLDDASVLEELFDLFDKAFSIASIKPLLE